MNKIICDICGKNETSREFMIKRREKLLFMERLGRNRYLRRMC